MRKQRIILLLIFAAFTAKNKSLIPSEQRHIIATDPQMLENPPKRIYLTLQFNCHTYLCISMPTIC